MNLYNCHPLSLKRGKIKAERGPKGVLIQDHLIDYYVSFFSQKDSTQGSSIQAKYDVILLVCLSPFFLPPRSSPLQSIFFSALFLLFFDFFSPTVIYQFSPKRPDPRIPLFFLGIWRIQLAQS